MPDNTLFVAVVALATILISMTLHEAMHAFTSFWLGDDTAKFEGRLTLNPIKHIDPFLTVLMPVTFALLGLPVIGAAKPVPFNPARVRFGEYGAALVGLAGPLTNLVFAALGAGVLRLIGYQDGALLSDILIVFMSVNIAFFVFNMIPFPPLDGSRVLYAFAPEPLQKIMYQIESFGLFGLMIFLFLFLPNLGPLISSVFNAIFRVLVGV